MMQRLDGALVNGAARIAARYIYRVTLPRIGTIILGRAPRPRPLMDLIDFRRVPGMVVGRISFDVLCPSRRVPAVHAARSRREPTRVKTGGPLRSGPTKRAREVYSSDLSVRQAPFVGSHCVGKNHRASTNVEERISRCVYFFSPSPSSLFSSSCEKKRESSRKRFSVDTRELGQISEILRNYTLLINFSVLDSSELQSSRP